MGDGTTTYTMKDIDEQRWNRIKDSIPRSAGSVKETVLERLEQLADARDHLRPETSLSSVLEALAAARTAQVTTDDRARARLREAGAEEHTTYRVVILEELDDQEADDR